MKLLHVHASCHNVGDHILVGHLRDGLRARIPTVSFASATHRPDGAYPDSEFVPVDDIIEGRIPSDRLRTMRGVIVGGGDIITGRRSFRLFRTLVAAGLPVFFVGVGVNVANVAALLRSPLLRGLDSAKGIWTRESASAEILLDAGVNRSVPSVDLSVAGFDSKQFRSRAGRPSNNPPRIAVSLRKPEGNTARWGSEEFRFLASLFDRWIESGRASVTLISMTGPHRAQSRGNDDVAVLMELRGTMRRGDTVDILELSPSPQDFLAELDRVDLLFGMRLHALALATLAGIPVVPLSYSPKIASWWSPFEAVLGTPSTLLPPEEWQNSDRIEEAVDAALGRTASDSIQVGEVLAQQHRLGEETLDALAKQVRQLEEVRLRMFRYRVQARAWEPARDVLERLASRVSR